MLQNIFKSATGLRAGWRLLIYAFLLVALGLSASKTADFLLRGRQPDIDKPVVVIFTFFVMSTVVLLAAWITARIEHRNLAIYGLPWRRAFSRRFWLAGIIGFSSLSLLLFVLRLARTYSPGRMQLHGAEIFRNAILWAVALILAAVFEEFFYRGYLQFTLSSGIGFWPAALITSVFMGAEHIFNPGWTALGLLTIVGFGLIACFLLRRTGDLWMPIGLHAAWNWGEVYFYGVPCSGLKGKGHLFEGSFHGPASLTGMPFGVEAGWPNIVLFLIWWLIFSKWFRKVNYPN